MVDEYDTSFIPKIYRRKYRRSKQLFGMPSQNLAGGRRRLMGATKRELMPSGGPCGKEKEEEREALKLIFR